MDNYVWWFVIGFGLVVAEMLTGTFYLLVIAIAFGAAALANAATNGTGPPYTKQGGKLVSYWRPDVDEWARKRMSCKVRSTSELRLPPAA